VLKIVQITKKILIVAIIAAILCALYFAWVNLIKKTQYKTKKAAVDRAEKQGIKAR
jgi:Tfp pilus assembly protein PilE